jgi:hypothetical protein
MKKCGLVALLVFMSLRSFSWGFYGHKIINYYAVFLLPPEMIVLYKPNIDFISGHAIDPDKRRYAVTDEGPRHYIDMDRYRGSPFDSLPENWKNAVEKYSEDTLKAHGIVPWWIQVMMQRLTAAFRELNQAKILKLSAEIGHYIGDAHVPLHACSNHNGQLTNQQGIHGFWESRIPEMLAEKEWDLFIGRADYIPNPLKFTWSRVYESAEEADSVLLTDRKLNIDFPADRKYAFENRNGLMVKQYSGEYSIAYNFMLDGMIERRLRQSIYAVASFWYTAWVNAGQPDLKKLVHKEFSEEQMKEFDELNIKWRTGEIKGKSCD